MGKRKGSKVGVVREGGWGKERVQKCAEERRRKKTDFSFLFLQRFFFLSFFRPLDCKAKANWIQILDREKKKREKKKRRKQRLKLLDQAWNYQHTSSDRCENKHSNFGFPFRRTLPSTNRGKKCEIEARVGWRVI